LSSTPSVDLAQLVQEDVPAQTAGEPLDPVVRQIIRETPFFQRGGCRTHDEFLKLCEELVRSVEALREAGAVPEADNDAEETNYAAKLRRAQIEFQRDAAGDLVAMRNVMEENDSLISLRNDLFRTPPRGTAGRGAQSVRIRSPERPPQQRRHAATPSSRRHRPLF
jgi:hypothetical protein